MYFFVNEKKKWVFNERENPSRGCKIGTRIPVRLKTGQRISSKKGTSASALAFWEPVKGEDFPSLSATQIANRARNIHGGLIHDQSSTGRSCMCQA